MTPKFYYVTKYALSTGIMQLDPAYVTIVEGKYLQYRTTNHRLFIARSEWFMNLDEAMAHAEELRKKKIQSLRKQISQLGTKDITKLDVLVSDEVHDE